MAVENSRAMDPYPYDPIRGSLTVTNLVTSKHQTAQPDQGNQRQATCWNLGSLPIRQISGDHSIRFLQTGRDADITIIIHREKVTVLHHPGLFGHSFGFALGQDQFKSPFIVFICWKKHKTETGCEPTIYGHIRATLSSQNLLQLTTLLSLSFAISLQPPAQCLERLDGICNLQGGRRVTIMPVGWCWM